ncbi:MAG TPA: tetratricopeptide repeat protein [Polyangiaceae bacterium]|nr:tetratricopeptide repeat protein [Polyangiaceae bacterium]
MTDPERISKRSAGLSAQLLQAGAGEEPGGQGMQRTLAALGVSTAVVTSASAASAVAGSAVPTSAAGGAGAGSALAGGVVKAASTTLLVKWIGIGVVGGVGLAGVAAVATSPAPQAPATPAAVAAPPSAAAPLPVQHEADEPARPSASARAPENEATAPPIAAAARSSVSEPVVEPPFEVGAPLAAEVSYVDRARALLTSGQTEQGLSLLQSYEQKFPEARLLPEVLFLRLETCDRLGRKSEARAAARRLLDGFPKSPHAARARRVLEQP